MEHAACNYRWQNESHTNEQTYFVAVTDLVDYLNSTGKRFSKDTPIMWEGRKLVLWPDI